MHPIPRLLPLLLLVSAVRCFGGEPTATAPPVARMVERAVTDGERRHWSFVPPRRPGVPPVRDEAWVRNPIDRFLLAGLEANGQSHAAEADRTTLLRRLSFDLIGLPPTPEEVDRFLADDTPHAYEAQVDRLLASPHHGERWAQHWLDLARYADSDGFEFDQARPDAWRYRDWVVRALNDDMGYDTFVRLQLAGDEVRPDDPSAFIATGFNRCYPDMVDLNDQGLRRQNALNDITETTGLVFLGLTIGCARCHDHKFDPIRQSDFYRLEAFFTPSRFRDDYPIATMAEREANERERTSWEGEVAAIQAAVIRLESPVRNALRPGIPPGLNDVATAAFQTPEAERTRDEIRVVFEASAKDRRVDPKVWRWALDGTTATLRGALLARLDRLRKAAPPALPRARGLDEASSTAPPTFLLHRGDYQAKGPEVTPAFPTVLGPGVAASSPTVTPSPRSSGRRRALAEWLVRPDNPLTARVMVNRLWQGHFGRGIVATSSDFGTMGEEPSHPELLDWLATEFVRGGWSLKALHRLIVTSASYRQTSRSDRTSVRADPENALLGHFPRRRLDGEAIRDALLAVSGRLNPALEGPCVFPELPDELTRVPGKRDVWPVSPSIDDRDRRSLYVFIRRNLRYPFFEAFDRPDTNASCPVRARTTIAPQALTLMNGGLARESARLLARRVERDAGTDRDARIRRAYRLALARGPDPTELRLAAEFLGEGRELAHLCLALLNINEFVYIE